jgi:hypothetical protein
VPEFDDEVTPRVISPISEAEYLKIARRAVKEEKLQAFSAPNGYLYKFGLLFDEYKAKVDKIGKTLTITIAITAAILFGFFMGVAFIRFK